MTKQLTLSIIALILSLTFTGQTLISCEQFVKIKEIAQNQSQWQKFDLSDFDIIGYGKNQLEAIYNAKVQAIHYLTYREQQLHNPLIDSILSQFANIILNVPQDEMRIKKRKGQYQCQIYTVYYNPKTIDFIRDQINKFLNYTIVFDINPNVRFYSTDQMAINSFKNALNQIHTAFMDANFGLNQVINYNQLHLQQLPPKPANYNPCSQGFVYYRTGQKYVDYIEMLRHSNIDVDIAIILDTIRVHYDNQNTAVNFDILAFNIKNGRELLKYTSTYTINDRLPPLTAIDQALANNTLANDINNYMYQLVKRYANYLIAGGPFSVRICNNVFKNDDIKFTFLYKLNHCKAFDNLRPTDWINNGQKIGEVYTGVTYVNNMLDLRMLLRQMLKDVGINTNNIEINIIGTEYIITPKPNQKQQTQN